MSSKDGRSGSEGKEDGGEPKPTPAAEEPPLSESPSTSSSEAAEPQAGMAASAAVTVPKRNAATGNATANSAAAKLTNSVTNPCSSPQANRVRERERPHNRVAGSPATAVAAAGTSGASPHHKTGSGCVNANHGGRSHTRSQDRHRDHHHRDRDSHHRERHRDRTGGTASQEQGDYDSGASHSRPSNVVANREASNVKNISNSSASSSCSSLSSSPRVNDLEELPLPPAPAPQPPAVNNNNLQNAAPDNPMSYNWQAAKTTVKDRLAFMFNNETMADVHFVVGKEDQTQRVPAHKFVLAIGSAVFDAMFNGGMATTVAEIEIPDVEPAAFRALLKFLYSDEVQIDPETVMTTLYTAKKYAVPALERACVDFLKRNLSSDNAFMLLTQARLFDEPQLAALCLETIDKNTSEAIAAEGFTDIDLSTLCVVLERDTLGIRECKLFNAVCRWAVSECGRQNVPPTADTKRQVLGRALQLIRFPLMSVEEFAVGAAQSGILEDREVVELFLYYTVNPKPTVNFHDTPRCCLTGKEQVVSRFGQIESRWGYSGTSDRIRFKVNRRLFVVGFGLYGSIHGPAEYTVNIQIIHPDTGKVCGQNDTSFQCDGSNSTFRVMFKEPVEIQAVSSYIACATLKGPDSYYGTKGLRKATHESLASGKVTFEFTYAAGNNNGTSVEDGQLPEIIFYT